MGPVIFIGLSFFALFNQPKDELAFSNPMHKMHKNVFRHVAELPPLPDDATKGKAPEPGERLSATQRGPRPDLAADAPADGLSFSIIAPVSLGRALSVLIDDVNFIPAPAERSSGELPRIDRVHSSLRPPPAPKPPGAPETMIDIPQRSNTMLQITADQVNLRRSPGGAVNGQVNRGDLVQELERSGNWVRIELKSGSTIISGWVFSDFLAPAES